jgi:hypothetical protein
MDPAARKNQRHVDKQIRTSSHFVFLIYTDIYKSRGLYIRRFLLHTKVCCLVRVFELWIEICHLEH